MHLRNVEIFCEVVLRRSFSKAAEAHQVSQSSASQAVHLLEKRLGTELIDRSKRPFELTSAGEVYYEGCRKLLDRFRKIEDRVQQISNRVVGRVRLAAIYSVGLLQMDAYARQYRQLYPDVDLQLSYLHPDEVYSRVLSDDADLGLVSFPRDGGDVASICWQEQPMVAVFPPNHKMASTNSVSVGHLSGENMVSFTTELTIRKKVDRWLKQAKVSPNIVHEFDNIENIKRAIEIGSGFSILPQPTVRREVEAGTLHAAKIKDTDWQRPLGIIHRRNNKLASPVEKFIELLHEDPESFSSTEPTAQSTQDGLVSV